MNSTKYEKLAAKIAELVCKAESEGTMPQLRKDPEYRKLMASFKRLAGK